MNNGIERIDPGFLTTLATSILVRDIYIKCSFFVSKNK